MKSNVCRIDKFSADLDAILQESEKVAAYNNLTHKQALQLRLLCEELIGMVPNIIEKFSGEFWIDFDNGVCKVIASINIVGLTSEQKKELLGISTDGRNASATGIVGKIRNAIEDFFLNEDEYMNTFVSSSTRLHRPTEHSEFTGYAYTWSLEEYRCSVKKEEHPDAWDELEKSVIASVADDVIVGVKGSRADITIVKRFA